MLHLRELRLGHFRKGLGAVDRCDGAEGPLPPRAAINRRKLDRQLRGKSRRPVMTVQCWYPMFGCLCGSSRRVSR
jgi:hypothetical protein